MKQEKKLISYCKIMNLDVEIEDGFMLLEEREYCIVNDKELLFDEEMNFLPITDEEVYGFVYEFGGRWYTQEIDAETTMSELKYIGKAVTLLPNKSFLGIRSGYELRNGIGLYEEWIDKAKHLGIEALAICERTTLSGALLFQNACLAKDIKSIIGLTVPVQGEGVYDIKVYAKNFQGWTNLLKFSKIINLDEEITISEEFFIKNVEGLVVVADPKSMEFSHAPKCIDFYQLDTVRYLNSDKDRWYLNNLEKFLKSDLEPIRITDAFYLEKRDFVTREFLWNIAKSFDDKTDNQHFKTVDEYTRELIKLFEGGNESYIKLFRDAIDNEKKLVELCNFKYDTNTRHLPKYVMSEEESSRFNSNEELFMFLIRDGFKKRGVSSQKYIDRVKEEIRVLRKGDVIDYFLVLHDIVNYAKSEKILTGIGRGSAGGSLVSYLLGLIQIDPMDFNLLFERFLNTGRMGDLENYPSYIFEDEKGEKVELVEGTICKVLRNGVEENLFVHDVKEGDELLKY